MSDNKNRSRAGLTDIELGTIQSQVNDMHEIFMSGKGCHCGIANRLNIRWVWSAVCGLAFACGYAFTFLFQSVESLKHLYETLARTVKL